MERYNRCKDCERCWVGYSHTGQCLYCEGWDVISYDTYGPPPSWFKPPSHFWDWVFWMSICSPVFALVLFVIYGVLTQ